MYFWQLMALLLLRHASSVPDSDGDGDGDEDASTFLTVSGTSELLFGSIIKPTVDIMTAGFLSYHVNYIFVV